MLIYAAVIALIMVSGGPQAPSRRFHFSEILTVAQTQPSVAVADASAQMAQARAEEVDRIWLPKLELTLVGGPSPKVQCFPSRDQCISTEPSQLQAGFDGLFGRVDARADMPLYTFGKITAGQGASRAAAKGGEALADQARHVAMVDAAQAFFAVKLGRELTAMLDDGAQKLDQELARQQTLLARGSPEANDSDMRRMMALKAEVDVRRAEAQRVTRTGLAGVHYVTQDSHSDVDEGPLLPLAYDLPPVEVVREGAHMRPEQKAADFGVAAAAALVTLEKARLYPDVVLVASVTYAHSSSAEHPSNAYLVDPFNQKSTGAGVLLKWSPDLAVRLSKIAQAEADLRRAEATARMAEQGLPADAERVWSEVSNAQQRLAAAHNGERQTRGWLLSLVQAEAAGLTEPRDLADALLQNFAMRARVIQATFDWNVGVIRLQRALGQTPDVAKFIDEGA